MKQLDLKTADHLHAYIMCGGGGTRLWPLSRADNPKQNLTLVSNTTMLQQTAARTARLCFDGVEVGINLMGGQAQLADMFSVMHELGQQSGLLITEPFGKNTAPAVATASLVSASVGLKQGLDPLVLILPSDHIIAPVEKLITAINHGKDAADRGDIVVFGVEPTTPATGYGYIKVENSATIAPVLSFREKPDLETATRYLASGRHLWNAGIFLFRASTMIHALKSHCPDILDCTRATLDGSAADNGLIQLDPDLFQLIPAESIDFAVMEKASNITVVRADFDWHDVGSFASLMALADKDAAGNAVRGDVISHESSGNLLHSEGPLIATVGVNNLAVVATEDVTLITPLDRCEEVRHIVSALDQNQRREANTSPWLAEKGVLPGSLAARWREWLFKHSLPFWASHDLDHVHGGFHEVLDLSGHTTGADKRLRTMARMTYTYARAVTMGWQGDATSVVQHGFEFFNTAQQAPLGGWFKTFDAASIAKDTAEDAYDHAFVLLALAQAKLAGISPPNGMLDRVMGVVDALALTDKDGRFNGYAEDSAATLPRRSNPHMHLLEAFMLAYEAFEDPSFLHRSIQIQSLLETRFFDSKSLLLAEAFDQDLGFAGGAINSFEPGHQFEWAYLLNRLASLVDLAGVKVPGDASPSTAINGLFSNALALGINPVTGLAYDIVHRSGAPVHDRSRAWVQAEMLGCLTSLTSTHHAHLRYAAERCAHKLWQHYIQPAPNGMWIDVVDGRGRPATDTVPASTFYHLINCVDRYMDLSKQP